MQTPHPASAPARSVCWAATWNTAKIGLEHLWLQDGAADSMLLAVDDEHGPFRLTYRLSWTPAWRLRSADLHVGMGGEGRSLHLRTDGAGTWCDEHDNVITTLQGCLDIDIWPTPFTNAFPIRRAPMAIGERKRFRVAWVEAPLLSVHVREQAYTRLATTRYRFESLDESGFTADLDVDDEGVVLDYPGLFRRVAV